MFAGFVIAAYESLSCPQCEKMHLNIIVCRTGVNYSEDAEKVKNKQELEDFSEVQ